MLSFHNSQRVKNRYLNRVREHRAAERLTKSIGWQNGRGCAVGCTLRAYDHARYPIELGLPEWLARLEDAIFENLPNGAAMAWPERFLAAIPVGVSVEPVKHAVAMRRIDRMLDFLEPQFEDRSDAIDALGAVWQAHEAAWDGVPCDWTTARDLAWSAVSSAEAEAAGSTDAAAKMRWSAAASAAASAGWSASDSAEGAVESVVASVESAVEIDAGVETALWQAEADALTELLSALRKQRV